MGKNKHKKKHESKESAAKEMQQVAMEPSENSDISTRTDLVSSSTELFSGPLPHPYILSRYEQIVPGAAERILAMAEKQSAHRQSLEAQTVKSDNLKSTLGVVFAFVIVLLGFALAAYTAINGREIFASVLGAGLLVGLVSTFIYGTNLRKEEEGEEREG
ncbi:MAG TPA: DUF2335 domain-containing protein [Candidatus Paceibacterota bacterium]|nr:DUF2335 domain-containing protein [Candidatus Paceibacterota bacterium]